MSLQIVAGPSGSGKSTYVYEELIRESIAHPDRQFILIVPDQYSVSATKAICGLHPRGGILNIDVLSFSRLAHRIGDEVGRTQRAILDDTGKNLILRRVALTVEDELTFLKGRLKRPGYIHEVKSQLSEFYQYDISEDDLDRMIEDSRMQGALVGKLKDLKLLYHAFQSYIKDKYITTEESLDELCRMIPRSKLLAGSCVVFDHFTGFTPIQERVIRELLGVCRKVTVTLCLKQDGEGNADRLFELTGKTRTRLMAIAADAGSDVEPAMLLSDGDKRRYASNHPMDFLEKNLLRFDDRVFAKQQSAIRIFEAAGRRSEVQRCCGQIRKLIKEGYEYRQIAIETGDLEGYGELLEAELTRYRIPYYMDRPRNVMHNCGVMFLRYALRMLTEDFSRDSVLGFLRSSMTDFTTDEIDRFDVYLTAMGIRGRRRFSATFERGKGCEEADAIRSRLMVLLSPLLGDCRTAGDYSRSIYELCVAGRLQERLQQRAEEYRQRGDASAAKEYEKLYAGLMDLLDQICGLIGEDEMDASEYLAILEAGISEIRIGTIPQSVDQVMVGDMQRTRLEPVKALFFLGVNDGIIPARNAGGGLLSDVEREFLLSHGVTMAPGPRQKLYEQRLYLYQNMTKPSEMLFLSYSLLDGSGTGLLPSYLIRHVLNLYPELCVEREAEPGTDLSDVTSPEDGLDDLALLLRRYADGDDNGGDALFSLLRILSASYGDDASAYALKLASLFHYEPAPLSKEAVAAVYDPKGTISRLEQMAACPFAHFIRYELGLKEKEEYRFEQTDMGNLYHKVMQQLLGRLQKEDRKLWELEDEQLRTMISELLSQISSQYGYDILSATGRNAYRGRQMERVLFRSLKNTGYHLKKGGFVPAYFEHKFEETGKYPIRGVIDRIDVARIEDKMYVKVVDYKSGQQKLDDSKLYYGVSLQLPIYLSRATELLQSQNPSLQVLPAAMFYYMIRDPMIRDGGEDVAARLRKEMRAVGLFSEKEEVLRLLDSELMETGSSDVICASLTKAGAFGKGTQSASDFEMNGRIDYANQKAQELMEKIGEGDIAVHPIAIGYDDFDSCSYCRYRGICGFDDRIDGYEKTNCPKVDLSEKLSPDRGDTNKEGEETEA